MKRFVSVFLGLVLVVGVQSLDAQTKPPVMSHDAAGRDNCLMCHTAGAMEAVPDAPASHEGRDNATCAWCHAADADIQTADAPAVPHDLAGRENCLMCHTAGAMEAVPDAPASHEGRPSESCGWCHTSG